MFMLKFSKILFNSQMSPFVRLLQYSDAFMQHAATSRLHLASESARFCIKNLRP